MEFLAESIGLLDMTPPSVSSREGATTVFVRPDGGNSSSSGLRDDVSADGSGAGSGHNSAPCRGGSMGGHISRSLLFNPWQSWEHSRDNDREDELHHGEKGKIEKSKLDCDVESNGTTRGGQGGEGVGAVSGPSDAAGKTNALQKVVKSAEHISTLQESPQNGISSSPPQQVESSNNSNEFTTNGVSGDSYYEALTKYLGLHLSFSTLTKSPSASDIATATSFSLFHALAQTVSTSDTLESTTMDGSPSVADESAASTVQASSTSARMATMSAPATATITTPNAMHLTRSKQAPEVPAENIITKHITQRIDARTNYHCFTGNIDAVTGHLIHGTMLHRFTGEVYEGPFCATAVKDSKQNGENDDSNPGQADLDDDADDNNLDSSYYETVSLRHGNNATCRYANGLKFVGRFEWDHPKSGTWIMAGEWTYEGSVIVVDDNKDDYNNRNKFTIGYAKKILGMKARDKKMKQTAGASENNLTKLQTTKKLIGITGPLPGSVIFHGMGRLIRSDGLVYQGEFHHGLASGVGKEILPNGKGVYHGEFSGGLRHGVGTLIEECVMDEEAIAEAIEEEEGACDCNCSDRQDSDCGSQDDKASANGPHQREVSSTTYHSDRVNTSCNNPINELARFDSDHGPDFAAGGSDSLSSSGDRPSLNLAELDDDAENTAPRFSNYKDDTNAHIDDSFQETNPVSSPNKCTCKSPCDTQSARKRRQHYSSGVWCAGQFEIEDSHGTVFPDSNEVIEEWNRAKLGPMVDEPAKVGGTKEHCDDNDKIGSGDNRSDDYEGRIDQLNTVASLNRTTWDLLPEKWLGLGK